MREGGPIRFHRDFPSTSPVLLPRGWAEKREEERRRGEERRGQERRGDKRRAWYWYWFCHFCSSVQTPTMGCSACVAATCCCHRAQNRAAKIHQVVWRTRKEENINNDVHAKVKQCCSAPYSYRRSETVTWSQAQKLDKNMEATMPTWSKCFTKYTQTRESLLPEKDNA